MKSTASTPWPLGVRSSTILQFLALVLLSVAAFWTQLESLARLALGSGDLSHLLVAPFISAYLIWYRRVEIFSSPAHFSKWAVLATAGAAVFFGITSRFLPLPVGIAFLVAFWIAAFASCYGLGACRRAQFPLLLLFLMTPLPDFILNPTIRGLQIASAEVVEGIFHLFRVPALRDGLAFSFPQGSILIASECSGIRSSIAFLLTSLLVAHLALRTAWRKALLVASVIPMVALKNGIRIATLSILGFYVDPHFLSGRLHRNGGAVFFLLALVLWAPLVHALRDSEQRSKVNASAAGPHAAPASDLIR